MLSKMIVSLAFVAMTSSAYAVVDAKGCGADDSGAPCTKENAKDKCKGDTPVCLLINVDKDGKPHPVCSKKQGPGCKAKLPGACASGKHKSEGVCE